LRLRALHGIKSFFLFKTVAVTYGYGKVAQDWGYDYLIDYPQDIQRLM
jgi:hypothetical protein